MGRSAASTSAGRRRSGTATSRATPARGAKAPARKRAPTRRAAPAPRKATRRRSSDPKRARRAAPRRRRRSVLSLPRPRPPRITLGKSTWRTRIAVLVIALAVAAAGYFLWFRDSSFVAVNDVEVVGATSGEGKAVVAELTRVGESMSTLHVDRDRLEAVATSFKTIAAVEIDPNFPHGLRLELTERPPVILVPEGDAEIPLAADGTVLAGVPVPEKNDLPVLDVDGSLAGGDLEGEALERALVVGAAPAPLRALVERVEHTRDFGVVVTLRGGIPVRFGTSDRLTAKWRGAAAVLADPKLEYTTYVDVRIPGRPAAGAAARSVDELLP